MKINLDEACLQNPSVRKFISDLWCYEKGHFELGSVSTKDLRDDDDSNLELLLHGDYHNPVVGNNLRISSSLLNSLKDNNVIEILDVFKDSYELIFGEHSGFTFHIYAKLVSKQKLKNYVYAISRSTIDEQLGMSKQVRVLKEQLRKKFIHFENRSLKIKWEDIPTKLQNNFNLLGSLFELEREELVSLKFRSIDLNVQEMLLNNEGNPHSVPAKYGRINFECTVKIQDKLIVEWSSKADIDFDDVKFVSSSGSLWVEGNEIFFCNSDTDISKVLSVLVDNINSIVPYSELAQASWHMSGEEIYKMYEVDGKTSVNTKTKRIITDIRKKIEAFKLTKKLTIKADNGYGLFHSRSEYDIEDLAFKLRISEVPF